MKEIIIYTDGGARGNPGPAAFALLIYDSEGKLLTSHSEYIGEQTNNVAEYRAVVKALKMAGKYKPGSVKCVMDSKLVANQLSGNYKIKKPHLRELHDMAKKAEKGLGTAEVEYQNVRREDKRIGLADRMLNMMLDKVVGSVK
jgi:ribonuclease HI